MVDKNEKKSSGMSYLSHSPEVVKEVEKDKDKDLRNVDVGIDPTMVNPIDDTFKVYPKPKGSPNKWASIDKEFEDVEEDEIEDDGPEL